MRLRLLLILAVLAPMGLWAKRVPPKPVSPVVYAGVTYSVAGDGREGYVVAIETSTGKELWKVKVFTVHIKGWTEEDVQWVFITDLSLDSNALLIRDEKSRCYRLDLEKKRVKKDKCH
jgi:outer membrane protein assembly factor BamB